MAFENIDDRRKRTEIAQRKITITTAASTDGEITIPINGELLNYIAVAPVMAAAASYDFILENADSEEMYKNSAIAENTSTLVLLSAAPVPMSGSVTFKIHLNAGDTTSVDIYLYYK